MSRPAGRLLAERLRARLPEIEHTIFGRIEAVSDPRIGDPDYLLGLRATIQAALNYALAALENGEEGAGALPPALLDQARKAARNGISLDTVLRRYLAGHTLLVDLVIREAGEDRSLRDALQDLLATQSALLDRLLAAVAEEHSRVSEEMGRDLSAEARSLRAVKRLLAGEALQTPEFRYELSGFHLALLAAGSAAEPTLRNLAAALDRSLLIVRPDETTIWAWLGGRRSVDPADLLKEVPSAPSVGLRLALGESGEGVAGWRQSHRQARAAWPIARGGSEVAVRYADVALEASILQDNILLDSLRTLYLAPLAGERDGGETLRGTLEAYFAAERSAASAAAALGVSRQTVNTRLRTVEQRLGRPLADCAAQLEAALRTHQLSHCYQAPIRSGTKMPLAIE